jgi:elongation factor Ts
MLFLAPKPKRAIQKFSFLDLGQMIRFSLTARLFSSIRPFSTLGTPKPPAKLIVELRKATDVTITKAREALIASNNDVKAAMEWLGKDLIRSGAQKAAKIEGRNAQEGLISLSVMEGSGLGGVRAAMVELNCETDFVARSGLFGKLASDIAHTAAFISEASDHSRACLTPCSLPFLNEAPLVEAGTISHPPSQTVADSIRQVVAKVGEKISLRRAMVVVQGQEQLASQTVGYRVASYAHGSEDTSQGRIGALALVGLYSNFTPTLLRSDKFLEKLRRLERALGRQIVGFETRSIQSLPGDTDETALYNTPFMMLNGSEDSVEVALQKWSRENKMTEGIAEDPERGVHVLEFAKWTVGETLDTQMGS